MLIRVKLILLLSCMLLVETSAQKKTPFYVGAFVGAQHLRHLNCALEDPTLHRGEGSVSGVRLYYRIGKRFYLNFGFYVNKMYSKNENVWNGSIVEFPFHFRYDIIQTSRSKYFTSIGLALLFPEGGEFPVSIGYSKKIRENFELVFMSRLPNPVVVTDVVGTFGYISYRIEAGLLYNIGAKPGALFDRSYYKGRHHNTRYLWERH